MRSDPPRHGAQILYHQRYYLGQDQDWLIAFLREITLATLVIHVDGEFHSTALPLPVNEKIEDVGATLRFLPPCSPDINPIEKAFSRLKDMLRKAAGRTVCCLQELIGRLVDIFQLGVCANYLESCGYEPEWAETALRRSGSAELQKGVVRDSVHPALLRELSEDFDLATIIPAGVTAGLSGRLPIVSHVAGNAFGFDRRFRSRVRPEPSNIP